MAHPLLTTKLTLPPLRLVIPRPRLLQRLGEGMRGKMTLVSAPAGYGKTTLLIQWAHTSGKPVAWLSLDEGDNDVARFLAYLLAALRRLAPEVGAGALALLGSTRGLPTEHILTSLINDIASSASANEQRFILVLDDYHLISSLEIHDLLTFLLEHMPPQLHLVLATRADPPLPLSRLRARREMAEIRQEHLQFTLGQTAAFLNQIADLGLSVQDVAALHARSEGWITGLQMAALALRGSTSRPGGERSARVRAFAGNQRYILDYLLEEVLQRQPESIQAFLLQTSVLPQLTGALCDAVLPAADAGYQLADGRRFRDSQAVLEYLDASNLFVVALDDERKWYRYHQLFADLLAMRLSQEMPEREPVVRRRASVWYEQHGLVDLAIKQATAGGDYEGAARLLEGAAEGMLMRSEVRTLLRLLDAMPAQVVSDHPRLRGYCGGARLLMGEPLQRVQPFLEEAGEASAPVAELAAFRALQALLQGDVTTSQARSQQALQTLPPDNRFLRGLVVENLAFVHVLRGDFAGAERAFAEAVRLGRASGNLLVAVGALCNLAGLYTTRGQLQQAAATYREALALAQDQRGQLLPIAAKALFGLGDLYREWNDLEQAGAYLVRALELFRQVGEIGLIFAGTSLARVRLAQGDAAAAEALLQQAECQAAKMDSSDMDDFLVDVYRIHFWLLRGDVAEAERRAATASLETVATTAPQLRETAEAILGRLRLAQGCPEAALALLQPWLTQAEQKGRLGTQIKLSVPVALAQEAQGERKRALSTLARALDVAGPEGYMRAFLDESAPPYGQTALPQLLYALAAQEQHAAYAGRLLAAIAGRERPAEPPQAVPAGAEAGAAALVERLSERELEVLQLVAHGLSNREIADRLVLALSTVKGHTSNIYGKLGVRKRTQAVARAQTLGLLS